MSSTKRIPEKKIHCSGNVQRVCMAVQKIFLLKKKIVFVEKKNRYKFFFNVNLKNYTDGLLTD